jgi:hypothetical protein
MEREMVGGRGPFWSDSIGFPFFGSQKKKNVQRRFIQSRRDETESPVSVGCAPLSGNGWQRSQPE